LVVLLALIGGLLYMQADAMRAALPQAGLFLDSYVAFVDTLRFRLDDLARSLASSSGTAP